MPLICCGIKNYSHYEMKIVAMWPLLHDHESWCKTIVNALLYYEKSTRKNALRVSIFLFNISEYLMNIARLPRFLIGQFQRYFINHIFFCYFIADSHFLSRLIKLFSIFVREFRDSKKNKTFESFQSMWRVTFSIIGYIRWWIGVDVRVWVAMYVQS